MAEAEEIKRIPLFRVSTQESLDSPIDRRSDYYRQTARQTSKSHRPPRQPLVTLPNVLTFIRLLLVPVLGVLWFADIPSSAFCCTMVFSAASATDWLDGFLARKLQLTTVFGAFLDPVADKLMVCTALILLTISPPEPLSQQQLAWPVIAIICREITMSALREWAAASGGAAHKAVKVNSLGKWKTALQMVAMTLLMLQRQHYGLIAEHWVVDSVYAAWFLLCGAALLGLWSLAIYMSNVWTHFLYPPVKDS